MSEMIESEDRRRQIRGWVNALQDAARNLSSVAFRASEAFDGSPECVTFHELGVELGRLEKLSPRFDKMRLLGMKLPPKAEKP
jgi:hypothetical protein